MGNELAVKQWLGVKQSRRQVKRIGAHLSVRRSSPALAAGVAAVGAKRRAFHRVRRAGGGRGAALGETQASAVILLTLNRRLRKTESLVAEKRTCAIA